MVSSLPPSLQMPFLLLKTTTIILLLIILHPSITLVVDASLTLRLFNNTALSDHTVTGAPLSPPHSSLVDDLELNLWNTGYAWSAEITGQLNFPAATEQYAFSCNFSVTASSSVVAFLWIDDHLVCQTGAYQPNPSTADGSDSNPLLIPINGWKYSMTVRMHVYSSNGDRFSESVKWKAMSAEVYSSIPSSSFSEGLPPVEVTRQHLQQSLSSGWAPWMHSNILALAALPEGFKILPSLCHIDTKECISEATVTVTGHSGVTVRVGSHAYDRSYFQLFLGWKGVNVSLSYSGGSSLLGLFEIISCPGNCDDFAFVIAGEMAWSRAGTVHPIGNRLLASVSGMEDIELFTTFDNDPSLALADGIGDLPHIAVKLSQRGETIAFWSGQSHLQPDTSATIVQHLMDQALEKEISSYKKFGDLAETKEAVQAGLMWNLIYNPAELGPFFPVARSWDFTPKPKSRDWTYVIFDWDNIFASYMTALDAKEISYSNLIQVIRSKTAEGFVPNFAAGGKKSADRSEPPNGARVLWEIYSKYHDQWLVELLFDDILGWNQWFYKERMLQPLQMICLGSNPKAGVVGGSNNMQSARYESGLDNSPMYDGEFFDTNTHLMQLYDVGMTSMVIEETEALVKLAEVIGRNESKLLVRQANSLRLSLSTNLWLPSLHVFANKFVNGTFYPRISPTSFYPLMAHAASDVQANFLVEEWLLNSKRFCISLNWPQGVDDTCFWGLPSINAQDAAFPPLGYWRGYVWGPMAQFTYWSLLEYDHLPSVSAARKALCKQMNAMMLSQWRSNR